MKCEICATQRNSGSVLENTKPYLPPNPSLAKRDAVIHEVGLCREKDTIVEERELVLAALDEIFEGVPTLGLAEIGTRKEALKHALYAAVLKPQKIRFTQAVVNKEIAKFMNSMNRREAVK